MVTQIRVSGKDSISFQIATSINSNMYSRPVETDVLKDSIFSLFKKCLTTKD